MSGSHIELPDPSRFPESEPVDDQGIQPELPSPLRFPESEPVDGQGSQPDDDVGDLHVQLEHMQLPDDPVLLSPIHHPAVLLTNNEWEDVNSQADGGFNRFLAIIRERVEAIEGPGRVTHDSVDPNANLARYLLGASDGKDDIEIERLRGYFIQLKNSHFHMLSPVFQRLSNRLPPGLQPFDERKAEPANRSPLNIFQEQGRSRAQSSPGVPTSHEPRYGSGPSI